MGNKRIRKNGYKRSLKARLKKSVPINSNDSMPNYTGAKRGRKPKVMVINEFFYSFFLLV